MTEEEIKKLALDEAQKLIPVTLPVRFFYRSKEGDLAPCLSWDCRRIKDAPNAQFMVRFKPDGSDLNSALKIAADELLPLCK